MERERIIVIVVPGRLDRAFYKRFLMLLAKIIDAEYIDLDESRNQEEKHSLLSQLYKPVLPTQRVRLKASALLLSKGGSRLAIIIISSEGDPVGVAAAIIGYQIGLREPSIDAIIVAEDAEDKKFEERLQALRDSLASQEPLLGETFRKRNSQVRKGHYYEEYVLDEHPELKLLLVAQGVKEVEEIVNVTKHAVEDYIIVTKGDTIMNILNLLQRGSCIPLQELLGNKRSLHKKLAQLVAIMHCSTGIEEFIYQGISSDDVRRLIDINDALKRIKEIIEQMLGEQRL